MMTFKKLLDLMIPIIPNILLTVLPSAFRYMGNIIEKKMFCSDKQVEKANMEFACKCYSISEPFKAQTLTKK